MGAWLAGRGVTPQRALVSTARRTRETWDGLRSGGVSGEVTFDASLYHATSDATRHAVAACPARAVLVLGHNPGIARLAEELARSAPPHGRFHDFPTCASLVLTFEEEDWTRALSARGDVAGFAVPADLGGT